MFNKIISFVRLPKDPFSNLPILCLTKVSAKGLTRGKPVKHLVISDLRSTNKKSVILKIHVQLFLSFRCLLAKIYINYNNGGRFIRGINSFNWMSINLVLRLLPGVSS